MKINVEIDCTPEEARSFLGLPDVGKANQFYVALQAQGGGKLSEGSRRTILATIRGELAS